MQTATLSKTAVTRATEIAQSLNANAVIVIVKVGDNENQMAVSEEAYNNRDMSFSAELEVIATVDPSGVVL